RWGARRKLCDRISDAAIDAFLRQVPGAHSVVERSVSGGAIAADATADQPSLPRRSSPATMREFPPATSTRRG
ncbi:MAG: hypothetical protein C3F11_03880, partial [Methylocystaceae bacterium]